MPQNSTYISTHRSKHDSYVISSLCVNIAKSCSLIRSIPRLSISSMVGRLKQESAIASWKKHPVILKRNFWKERTFWSDGYFVCSIGQASPQTIRQYILSQG